MSSKLKHILQVGSALVIVSVLLFAQPKEASAALAIDTGGSWYSNSGSATVNFTNAGNVLVVFVSTDSAGTPTTTYGGVSVPQRAVSGNNTGREFIYALASPPTGANDLVVTNPGGADLLEVLFITFSGADTSLSGATSTAVGTSATGSSTLTTKAVSSTVVGAVGTYGGFPTQAIAAPNNYTGVNNRSAMGYATTSATSTKTVSVAFGASFAWHAASIEIQQSTANTKVMIFSQSVPFRPEKAVALKATAPVT